MAAAADYDDEEMSLNKKIIKAFFAIVLSLILILGIFFQISSASLFYEIQYPATNAPRGHSGNTQLYGYGKADALTLIFYAISIFFLRTCADDLFQKFFGQTEYEELQMTSFLFCGYSFITGIIILSEGIYDFASYFNGLQNPEYVPYCIKVFYIIQIAYMIQYFPYTMFQGYNMEEAAYSMKEPGILSLFLFFTFFANLEPLAVWILTVRYFCKLLEYAELFNDSNWLPFGNLVIESLMEMITAFCMLCYGRSTLLRAICLLAAVARAIGGWYYLKSQAICCCGSQRASSKGKAKGTKASSATKRR